MHFKLMPQGIVLTYEQRSAKTLITNDYILVQFIIERPHGVHINSTALNGTTQPSELYPSINQLTKYLTQAQKLSGSQLSSHVKSETKK